MLRGHQARRTALVLVGSAREGWAVALFAIVHGSMAGPAAYTRLTEELGRLGQRTLLVELPVDRPELTGTDYALSLIHI